METRRIKPGDHIEANVNGVVFEATVRSKPDGLIGIDPLEPHRYSWRFVKPRQVVRVLEKQGRLVA